MRKVARIVTYVFVFAVVFFGSITIRDALYEQYIQTNAKRITVGMSQAEVIAILGEPTSKHMTDGPGTYWCYGSDSWTDSGDSYCGNVAFEMGSNGVNSIPK